MEASPDGKLYEAFMERAYSTHPYGIPIVGLPKDLTFMSPAAIHAIHRKYLSPRRIVIAVVGDIDPSKTMELIRRYFGKIPDAGAPAARIPAEPVKVPRRSRTHAAPLAKFRPESGRRRAASLQTLHRLE